MKNICDGKVEAVKMLTIGIILSGIVALAVSILSAITDRDDDVFVIVGVLVVIGGLLLFWVSGESSRNIETELEEEKSAIIQEYKDLVINGDMTQEDVKEIVMRIDEYNEEQKELRTESIYVFFECTLEPIEYQLAKDTIILNVAE